MAKIDVFTLEALDAEQGDSLLLHYGPSARPLTLLIDGGPRGVYQKTLKPRLEALKKQSGSSEYMVQHTFVTHLDSDHIRGIVDFAAEIKKGDAPADCTSFWFNTFEDAITTLPPAAKAAKQALDDAKLKSSCAVLASVGEGQSLRDTVAAIRAKVNGGSGQLLVADGKGVALNISKDLVVTLVSPNLEQLRNLEKDWKKKAKPTEAETAAYVDNSVYNLSSLVMVVEATGAKGAARMLLTGDARGDHIIAGLQAGGFLSKGKAHFNILKVPHHGSDRNLTGEFFKSITADNYVISANGRDENPSEDTLEWIAAGAKAPYILWMTNESNATYTALQKNIASAKKKAPALGATLKFRARGEPSVKVNLFSPIK